MRNHATSWSPDFGTVLKTEWPRLSTEASSGRVPPGVIAIVASCKCWGSMMFIYIYSISRQYVYGKTPQFARAYVDDMSEQQKTLCFVGQNAHVHDHGFHLATHSLATCALNVTTTSSWSSSSSSASSTSSPSSSSSSNPCWRSSMNVEV